MSGNKENTYTRELKTLKEDFDDLKKYLDEIKEILPIAVCTLSSFWVIVDVNKATEILTGYKPLEIIGHPLDIILKEKQKLEKVKKEVEKRKKAISKELVLISKSKKRIPVNISIVCRKDPEGNPIGYFLIVSDISRSKRYQEDLEKRTEELEKSRSALMNILEDVEEARGRAEEERDKTSAIITHFADGLMVLGKENKIILINPEAEKLLRVKARAVEEKVLQSFTQPSSLKKLAELLGTKEAEESLFRKELFLKKPKEQVLEVTTVSLAPKEEKIIILHNISREKLIEKMKTEFVSLTAHQLRTPLSAIKWTLRMLLDGDLGKITEEQRGFIEKTYGSNERMISLINALLDITRIEEGRYIYKPVFARIENVAQFVINSFKEETERKKIRFEFKKPKKRLPRVKIDVEKIRLALDNLLDNAISYTPEGGGVTVSLKCGKKEIELSIKDTGVGIPEDQKERVFTKFFRGANVMRMETEGTGLGLFITKNIIEAHGGKIWFESEENKGTAFYFTLPVEKGFEEFLKKF